jgi:hypothetical protein
MKTTLDISDHLIVRARRLARDQRLTLRSLVEEGLARVLDERDARRPRPLKPITRGGKGMSAEFRGAGWAAIRDAAYRGRGA